MNMSRKQTHNFSIVSKYKQSKGNTIQLGLGFCYFRLNWVQQNISENLSYNVLQMF